MSSSSSGFRGCWEELVVGGKVAITLLCLLQSLACVLFSSCLPSPSSLTPAYKAVSSSDHRLAPALQVLSDAIWPFPRTGPTDASPEQRGTPCPSSSLTGLTQAQLCFSTWKTPASRGGGSRQDVGTIFGMLARESRGPQMGHSLSFQPLPQALPGSRSWLHIAPTTTLVWFRLRTWWQHTR